MPERDPFPNPDALLGGLGSGDPDHHLWRNGRLWWIAFTIHLPGWRKDRIRCSLGTDDLHEARRRRDTLLRDYPLANGCELSLRLSPRRMRAETPGLAA
jgi:hypothetical protein